MIKTKMKMILAVMIAVLLTAGVAYTAPIQLSETQLDSIAAGGVEKVTGFVCPVILQAAVGMHNPNAVPLGDSGTYTVGPPTNARGGALMIPVHATNADGLGIPGVTAGPNAQSQPGDTNYTAIWANQ